MAVDPAQPDSVHLTDCPGARRGPFAARARGRGGRWRARSWRWVGRREPPPASARASRWRAARVKLPAAPADGFRRGSGRRRGPDRRDPRRAERPGARACSTDESEMVERTPLPAAAGRSAPGTARTSARSWPARDRESGASGTMGGRRSAASRWQADEFELTARARARPRGRGGRRPAGGPRHDQLDAGAGGRGPGARGRASAPGAAQDSGLRDQRPRSVCHRPSCGARLVTQLDPHRDWLAAELLATRWRSASRPDCRTPAARATLELDGETAGTGGRPRLSSASR